MKFDIPNTTIAILISGLIAWWLYDKSCEVSNLAWLLALLSGLLLAVSGIGCVGLSFENKRSGAVVRVCFGIFFFFSLVINWIFASKDFSAHSFVIVNLVTFLITLLIAYSLYKTRL